MGKRVLIVMSSHAELGLSGKKTGTWFEEVATPYYVLREAGHEVVLGSLEGGEPPLDLLSLQAPFTTPNTDRFAEDPVAQFAFKHTNVLRDLNLEQFDALFFPGGYGLLWDIASDALTIRSVEGFVAADKPVAMVCHSPAILRDAKAVDGSPLVKGRELTGFSNAEDVELDLLRHLLFSLEDDLKGRGARYRSRSNWEPHVVVDGPLMTGQNPASAPALAKELADALAA